MKRVVWLVVVLLGVFFPLLVKASVSVTVSPASASVFVGEQQQFTATVTGTSNLSVIWSVSGSGCTGASCGTISTTGLYTAPATVPSPSQVAVTATSVAYPTSASASVLVLPPVSVTISPTSAQVVTGRQLQFSATVTGNSNHSVTWSVTGSGCTGTACGTISTTGLYTASATVPSPPQVAVTSTSVADRHKSASAAVTIQSPVSVSISPTSAQVIIGATQHFTASVTGTTNTAVTWSVSGAGCTGSSCGTVSNTGVYTAPGSIPASPAVSVKATSVADPTKSATASVTILPHPSVTVAPASASVFASEQRQFTATVTGNSNHSVTWSVSGIGCTGTACGTISGSGLYTGPATLPSPPVVSVKATSVVDPTSSAGATVTLLPAVSVTISPTKVRVFIGNKQQFTATVTGNSNHSVTWSVSGAGCTGATCGTVSSSGLYTAPGTPPNPSQVTVKATSVADTTKSASATVTIAQPVSVTISPTIARVVLNGQQQFIATVTGSTNTTVSWSLSGSGCNGASCGTISGAGLYTAPATLPSPPQLLVTAVSVADPTKSATATVSLLGGNNAKFAGQYAFQFKGFDSNGIYEAVGSLTADGTGHITVGLMDVNNTVGPQVSLPVTGSYSVTGDNRGTLTISSSLGSQTFAFALNQLGTEAQFIAFETTGLRGSGVLKQQDATAFRNSAIRGGYALSLTGTDSNGGRIGAVGVLLLDGNGDVLIGTLDVNDNGVVLPTFGSVTGTYNVASSGRGALSLSTPGFAGLNFSFSFYVVSAGELFSLSLNQLGVNIPLFGGPLERQSGSPFTLSAFNGGSIFTMSGATGSTSQVTVGRFLFNGAGNLQQVYDRNVAGNVTTGNLGGTYNVDITGRGTITLFTANGPVIWDLYTISPNRAFLMDATTAAVGMGDLAPQTTQPYNDTSISGQYSLGSGETLLPTTTLYSGTSSFDGKGAATGTEDISFASTISAGQALAGTYSVSTTTNNGRGGLQLTSPTAANIRLWVIGTSGVVGLDVDPTNVEPVLLRFQQ